MFHFFKERISSFPISKIPTNQNFTSLDFFNLRSISLLGRQWIDIENCTRVLRSLATRNFTEALEKREKKIDANQKLTDLFYDTHLPGSHQIYLPDLPCSLVSHVDTRQCALSRVFIT